jgi:hypothetical protein
MTEEDTMPGESSPIGGEVVAREEAGLRVRLDDGRLGLLPRSAGPNLATGYRGGFRVERRGANGDLLLSIAVGASEPPRHTFDQEFDRLQDALANHGPHNLRRPRTPDDALGQKRIEQWMADVEEAIARLRKRRPKRLNRQT